MKKQIVLISVLFISVFLLSLCSCKKDKTIITEVERKIVNPEIEVEMIDGTNAIITSCQTIGDIEGIEVNLSGAVSQKINLTLYGNTWVDTIELSNTGVDGYIHGFFKPIYDGIVQTENGVNSITSNDPFLQWEVTTSVELGDAVHEPTTTGGISTIEIRNIEKNNVVNVLATRVSDNLVLGTYSIDVNSSSNNFNVIVNYTDSPIFNTEINLRVSIDDLVKNYRYTTLEEETCVLNFEGSYVIGENNVIISISGNDRLSNFTFKALDINNSLITTYEGVMYEDEESKNFSFPIEAGSGINVHYVVTSEQHPLCIYDEFSYTTPNRVTMVSVSGASPGSLKPSGGTIYGSFTNENFLDGEVSELVIQSPSSGIDFIDPNTGDIIPYVTITLDGEIGTFTYDFVSDRDENNAVFTYSCDYFESQVANTTITTLTQTYDLNANVDILKIDSLQTATTQFLSCDLNTNYIGTKGKKVTLKIKNTLNGHYPWEYLNLLVINGINFPVSTSGDWGNVDSEGFYTFTIDITNDINISNIDYVTISYRSKAFIKGNGDTFEMKVSVEADFLDNTTNVNFQPWSQTLSVEIE